MLVIRREGNSHLFNRTASFDVPGLHVLPSEVPFVRLENALFGSG